MVTILWTEMIQKREAESAGEGLVMLNRLSWEAPEEGTLEQRPKEEQLSCHRTFWAEETASAKCCGRTHGAGAAKRP